ncbi:universal stress protein [Flavobacterium caeni]|uniref:Nucleotide-binding universal stress protein, UspA family n=1 Tax=Flavobacterium caeni TaxID=490189 RepID=A0A1G5JXU4_9FLAO|nr:universal stress protein [Flavobacterium caeni]SCY92680.1 Nucleotide-binding universal stress protein, UspA family [Flavobacterium caeni]
MKKILFPTDFSEVSNNAFAYALKLAETLKAEIITLHVYDLPIIDNEGFPNYLLEMYDVLEVGQFENYKGQVPILRDIAQKHGLEHIKLSHELLMGDLVANIKMLCKRDHIEYVVMGTKGASGLKETFLGSTAGTVIAETDAFVLAIPEHCRYHAITNIAFTSRFKDKDRKALHQVVKIAKGFNAQVHCLYVRTSHSDVKEVTMRDWEYVFGEYDVQFHVIENENVKDTILGFTDNEKIDLLAMLHYKRNFLEELFHHSLTKKIAHHIQIPILALHEN